jgi:Fe-S cluster assembly iron-binding protein IscA
VYLTIDAARFLDGIRRASALPDTAGILISAPPGHTGRRIEVAFAPAPRTGDVVVERSGARVFVTPAMAAALSNTVVDVDCTVEPPDLVLRSAALTHRQVGEPAHTRPEVV